MTAQPGALTSILTWLPPDPIGEFPAVKYGVALKDVSQQVNTTELTYQFTNLQPNTQYTAVVRSYNFFGYGSTTNAEITFTAIGMYSSLTFDDEFFVFKYL